MFGGKRLAALSLIVCVLGLPQLAGARLPAVPWQQGRNPSLTKPGQGPLRATIDRVFNLERLKIASGGSLPRTALVGGHKFTRNNRIDLLVDGHQAFSALFSALKKAKDSIHVSYYILRDDKLGTAFARQLMRKAREGVEVRVMVDGLGSLQMWGSPKRALFDRLQKAGVQVIRNHVVNLFNPARHFNHPDHRKIVIVDGKVGFTGGMNVANHYVKPYHDLMVRVEGEAVQQMQAEWMTSWAYLGGRFDQRIKDQDALKRRFFPSVSGQPGGANALAVHSVPGEQNSILKTYLDTIKRARKSVYIENPYLTNHAVQDALAAAAKRGVETRVILPGQSDHGFSHLAARAKYGALLQAGVKLYEYPGFNHGKVMVVDEKFVTIGSSNLDDVALHHIYEMNLNVSNKSFAKDVLERVFKTDISKSRPMKEQDITRMQKLQGKFWNLFAHYI